MTENPEERAERGRVFLEMALPVEMGAEHIRRLAVQVAMCGTAFKRYLDGEKLDARAAFTESGVVL